MPKIAITGKGGVGKTSLTSLMAYVLAEKGNQVYAIDADPNATLAHALGLPVEIASQITPIVEMADLIEERTGARPGEYGKMFKLNPRVDDIPARFSVVHRGIHVLQMGSVRGAGAGCVCPENAMLKMLVTHLLLREQETVILDMVAGLEHLGRGTAGAVDAMLAVVEPGTRSIQTAKTIAGLAQDLGVSRFWVVGNKVRHERDEAFIRDSLDGLPVVGTLPYSEHAIDADMQSKALYDLASDMVEKTRDIVAAVLG
ncbi:MAG: AAA family ATPase [Anaerolineae bacterium]|nr:AAA family ATPase [Anaerolineae bacterium]